MKKTPYLNMISFVLSVIASYWVTIQMYYGLERVLNANAPTCAAPILFLPTTLVIYINFILLRLLLIGIWKICDHLAQKDIDNYHKKN